MVSELSGFVDKPEPHADEIRKLEQGAACILQKPLPDLCQPFRRGKILFDEGDV